LTFDNGAIGVESFSFGWLVIPKGTTKTYATVVAQVMIVRKINTVKNCSLRIPRPFISVLSNGCKMLVVVV
jgi:hypothetical protein